MNRPSFRTRRRLPYLACSAALALLGCRAGDEPGPGRRPTPPAARSAALATRDAGPGADGGSRPPQTRAGEGLEAVRAGVRGLVMLQETIGELAALQSRPLPGGATAGTAPEASAVQAGLESLRRLAAMEAAGAATLGLEDVLPMLQRTAQAATRWSELLVAALQAADDGGSLAARLAELPERLRALDGELRAARDARRGALAALLPPLAEEDRRRGDCLTAAADALYAWELLRHALEAPQPAEAAALPNGDGGASAPGDPPGAPSAAVEQARAVAASWRDFIDSGYPLELAPAHAPSTASASVEANDATARAACQGLTINALPPPGEDVPGPASAAGPRRPPR